MRPQLSDFVSLPAVSLSVVGGVRQLSDFVSFPAVSLSVVVGVSQCLFVCASARC